jgi:hypothetical protein
MAKQSKETTEEKDWCCAPEATREHLRSARKEMREAIKTLLPPEYITHRRAAKRELLMAARTLIDHAIERMEVKEGA